MLIMVDYLERCIFCLREKTGEVRAQQSVSPHSKICHIFIQSRELLYRVQLLCLKKNAIKLQLSFAVMKVLESARLTFGRSKSSSRYATLESSRRWSFTSRKISVGATRLREWIKQSELFSGPSANVQVFWCSLTRNVFA